MNGRSSSTTAGDSVRPLELARTGGSVGTVGTSRVPLLDITCPFANLAHNQDPMRRSLGRPPRATRGLARRLGRVRRAAADLEERVTKLREENTRLKSLLNRKEDVRLCKSELAVHGDSDSDSGQESCE